jgi:hypothetical protein
MMPRLPGLNMIERWALGILVRSRRTGLVVVKPYGYGCVFAAADATDPVASYVTSGPDEPASMVLERIYHQPAAGELE